MVQIVAADLDTHGPQVVSALREGDPAAYARLATDLSVFRELLRLHANPDKPAPECGEPTTQERLAEQLLTILEADFREHGAEVVARLRERKPNSYMQFAREARQFRMLDTMRHTPRREPRPLRMKDLLKAMDDQPIDVDNPLLPRKHRDRWLQAIIALQPRTPSDLTPDELRAAWGDDLAAWYERQIRRRVR